MRVFITHCKECGAPSVIKKTDWKDEKKCLVAVHYVACSDVECGHTFVMKTAYSHTLSPSSRAVKRFKDRIADKLTPEEQQFALDLLDAG